MFVKLTDIKTKLVIIPYKSEGKMVYAGIQLLLLLFFLYIYITNYQELEYKD